MNDNELTKNDDKAAVVNQSLYRLSSTTSTAMNDNGAANANQSLHRLSSTMSTAMNSNGTANMNQSLYSLSSSIFSAMYNNGTATDDNSTVHSNQSLYSSSSTMPSVMNSNWTPNASHSLYGLSSTVPTAMNSNWTANASHTLYGLSSTIAPAMYNNGTVMNNNGTANPYQSLNSLSSTMPATTQAQGNAQTGEVPQYICMNCGNGFPRLYTVKNVHFPDCIKRLGNSHNFAWNTHPSCRPKYGGRRPGAPHRLSPKSAAATRAIGRAKPKELNDCICILCGQGFTRAKTVMRHFPLCVKRHGNPDGLLWNDDPSCKPKQRGRVPEAGNATALKTEDDEDDKDEDMGGYVDPSAVAAGNDVDGAVAYGRSEYEEGGEDREMTDADEAYVVMSAGQLRGVDTHVRDGRPLERRSANWLFEFQNIGGDGYVMPSVFSTHDQGSNEHVHRSVVPHHLVHPGLAYGANAMMRTSTPSGEMNDLTPSTVLPSDTLQPSQHLDNMKPQRLQESFFLASSLPGAPYYGQTRRSPYHGASYRQTAMAASENQPNTGAMEGDRTGELGSNPQTRPSRSRVNLYAEESHDLGNIDPRLRTPNLQPALQEAHVHTPRQAEQSRGSRNDPASLFSGAAPSTGANFHVDHRGREVAPYLPYFEQKAQNPESTEAFAKRMQDVKNDICARLQARPGHVPSEADRELADQLFKCRQHAQE